MKSLYTDQQKGDINKRSVLERKNQGSGIRTPKDFLKLRQLSVYVLVNSTTTTQKILGFTTRTRASPSALTQVLSIVQSMVYSVR